MTAVRTGMSVLNGRIQAPVGLYKTTDGGETWALIWEPVPFAQPANRYVFRISCYKYWR